MPRLQKLIAWIPVAARWLLWPAVLVVTWGELRSQPDEIVFGYWDKVQHFTAYYGLALLATLAWGRRGRVLAIFLAVIAMGGALEILQSLVDRDAEWLDQLANTVGASFGLGTALVYQRLVAGRARD